MPFLRKFDRELKALADEFTNDELVSISKHGTIIDLPPGKTLFEEGQAGNEAVVIISGVARMIQGGRPLGTIEAGTVVGETAILTGAEREVTVASSSMLKISVLNSEGFLAVLAESPDFCERVGVTVEHRAA